MIQSIGVIYQDTFSLGFLEGLKARLGCQAELVRPPPGVGTGQFLTLRESKQAFSYFLTHGVDIVVRFTDADGRRWQEVRRAEEEAFPQQHSALTVCGVAVNNPEDWLALDPGYISSELKLDVSLIQNDPRRSDTIKRALKRNCPPEKPVSDFVCRLVMDAPEDVFQRWLEDEAFRRFYQDCRSIANRLECPIGPTEL